MRDDWFDFLLLKEVQQGQILSKQRRFQPFEGLDAVRDHPLPAREKSVANNVQAEDGGFAKAMTATDPPEANRLSRSLEVKP